MPFQYTFRGSDISSWESAARDLVENRDRELELYSTTIDTSFLNLNASNLTSGTVPSARMTGAYTGITGLGTLTSLTIDGPTSTAFTLGDSVAYANFGGVIGDKGYLLVSNSSGDTSMYLRTSTAGAVRIGALNSDTLVVGNGTATVAGTLTASGRIWAETDLRVGNSTSTVLSSTLYNLVVTPQAYTGLQVLLGEHYGLTGVGTTNNDFTVFANSTVRIKYVNNTIATFNSAGMTISGDASLSGQSLAVTSLAAGRGMCIRADSTNAQSILQFTNNAVTAQWSSLVATNNLLNVTTPFSVTGDVTISGSLRLSASANAAISTASTPDTALPWSQGPVLQGQTGWAFYSVVLSSYRMGFRSGSSGATRYMWSADSCLIGAQPNDASVTRTLNVIGTGKFTEILNPNGGISGTINYGSYGSFSVYSETNGWYGIAFPDSQSAWMSANNGQYFGVYRNNATWNFYVVNGTFTPSDERYKRDIEPLQHGMNLIRGIVPITFDPLTEDPADDPEQTVGRTHYGFTTQNILQALANVGETRDVALVDIGGPANESNESDRQYLNHSGLIAPMVKAIQELDQRLQQLETV